MSYLKEEDQRVQFKGIRPGWTPKGSNTSIDIQWNQCRFSDKIFYTKKESEISKTKDVAVGVIDVKSYYIETPEDVAKYVRHCLKFASADRLSFAPDCGLSQTARWAAKQKLQNMVEGVSIVRKELGIHD